MSMMSILAAGAAKGRVAVAVTLSSNTANYTLNTAKASGYVAGMTDITLTINSGVVIYSGSTGSYALTVDTSWASGDTVTIVNNGTILGRGGDGGSGGPAGRNNGGNGASGGPALYVQRATSINNVNRISGGGGGGGGGGGAQCVCYKQVVYAGGGSGGGGIGNGSPGGSLTSAGGGSGGGSTPTSQCGNATGGSGASGGGYGSAGGSGSRGDNSGCSGGGYGSGGSGGGAGAAVAGNANITWIATGTRNGAIT